MRAAGDPDFRAFFSSKFSFAEGVRLGVGNKTLRVPAVFEKKTKWRPYSEEHCLETGRDIDRENYLSAKDRAAVAQQQFEAEAKAAKPGAMLEFVCRGGAGQVRQKPGTCVLRCH